MDKINIIINFVSSVLKRLPQKSVDLDYSSFWIYVSEFKKKPTTSATMYLNTSRKDNLTKNGPVGEELLPEPHTTVYITLHSGFLTWLKYKLQRPRSVDGAYTSASA